VLNLCSVFGTITKSPIEEGKDDSPRGPALHSLGVW